MSYNIIFSINKASYDQIWQHLQECDDHFIPKLSTRVNLSAYAHKLSVNAHNFEAWDNKILIGLLAVYLNDSKSKCGFITNVSTNKAYSGQGIATNLLKRCIDYALKESFQKLQLEVNKHNHSAINLYKKAAFEEVFNKDDSLILELLINTHLS